MGNLCPTCWSDAAEHVDSVDDAIHVYACRACGDTWRRLAIPIAPARPATSAADDKVAESDDHNFAFGNRLADSK